MKALWSLWTKPALRPGSARWLSERHHLLAWALSFARAREFYPRTALITDSLGKRWLVDELGLPFDEVSTELDALADADPRFWALGKLYAYRAQTEPFVHLDNDVFLWKRLPAALEQAAVLAQNPEYFTPGDPMAYYQPTMLSSALLEHGDDPWLPEPWRWAVERPGVHTAACCGIFGGNDHAFIRRYAEQAIRMAEHPGNRSGWAAFDSHFDPNVHFEQYLLSACLDHQRHHGTEVEIAYLFPTHDAPFVADEAARVGYTHLIGNAKQNPELMERLDRRVLSEHPQLHERAAACSKLA
ncbi:DUF6734 family protein [Nannocystaceae bacterium ST9]